MFRSTRTIPYKILTNLTTPVFCSKSFNCNWFLTTIKWPKGIWCLKQKTSNLFQSPKHKQEHANRTVYNHPPPKKNKTQGSNQTLAPKNRANSTPSTEKPPTRKLSRNPVCLVAARVARSKVLTKNSQPPRPLRFLDELSGWWLVSWDFLDICVTWSCLVLIDWRRFWGNYLLRIERSMG